MTTYSGFRDQSGQAHVAVDQDGELRPLPHLVRHSPTGMAWGYAGSGPADLARSLLAHFLGGHVAPHPRIYQRFKAVVIASLQFREDSRARRSSHWVVWATIAVGTIWLVYAVFVGLVIVLGQIFCVSKLCRPPLY